MRTVDQLHMEENAQEKFSFIAACFQFQTSIGYEYKDQPQSSHLGLSGSLSGHVQSRGWDSELSTWGKAVGRGEKENKRGDLHGGILLVLESDRNRDGWRKNCDTHW